MALKYRFCLSIVLGVILFSGCKDVIDENSFFTDQIPNTGILETKPQNYPAGFGVDFESDSIVSLDEYPNFKYDLRMLAWRIQDPVTTAYGGRPVVFLWGNESTPTKALALNVSAFAGIGLGEEGFAEFNYVTRAMKDSLKADNKLPIDPNDTLLYPWKDGFIQMSEATLLSAYQALVIGDKVVRLAEADSPVWLIRTAEGNYFKWQHIERQGGGHVPIRWYRFKPFEMD